MCTTEQWQSTNWRLTRARQLIPTDIGTIYPRFQALFHVNMFCCMTFDPTKNQGSYHALQWICHVHSMVLCFLKQPLTVCIVWYNILLISSLSRWFSQVQSILPLPCTVLAISCTYAFLYCHWYLLLRPCTGRCAFLQRDNVSLQQLYMTVPTYQYPLHASTKR